MFVFQLKLNRYSTNVSTVERIAIDTDLTATGENKLASKRRPYRLVKTKDGDGLVNLKSMQVSVKHKNHTHTLSLSLSPISSSFFARDVT